MERKTAKLIFLLVLFLFPALFFLPIFLRAEIIQLKNGNAIETTILKEDERFVTVQAPGGKVKIPKSDIRMIWRGSPEELAVAQGKQASFSKGVKLYGNGQFEDAAGAFESALGPSAINPIIYANLGSVYASLGDAKKAEENFLRALEGNPNKPDILLNLAHFYEGLKNYREASVYYQKVMTLKPDDFKAKRSLAYCLYMLGDYSGAGEIFEELGKRNDDVAVSNAAAAYVQAGEIDRASALLAGLLEKPFPVPRAYLLMAEISRLRKDFSGAENLYEKALRSDPDVANVKIGLGRLYLDVKELDKAEAVFNEALAKDPASVGAMQGLAKVFTERGEFQKAITQYGRLAEKKPDDPAVLSSLGMVYLKMDQPKTALEVFRKILARNDLDAKTHTNAGLAYALMNDADNALMEWNRALELDPKLEPALRNKKLLENEMQGNQNDKTAPQ
ncbi:MAG: tetratricopeptide repeat protein [Candidatus Omnitrophota bacterium]